MAGGYGSIPDDEEGGAATSTPPARDNPERAALIAEFFGTATLVQIGCAANCIGIYLGAVSGIWQAATIWTLGAMLAIYMSGSASGGHLNPAVTVSFALVRGDDFKAHYSVPYILAQLAGAFVGALINYALFSTAISNYEANFTEDTNPLISAAAFGDYWSLSGNVANLAHAIFIEAFGTGFLCLVVFAATNPKSGVPSGAVPALVGVAIGLMVALLGNLTGAGINPARDMGPRLVTRLFGGWGKDSMTDWVAYAIGPLIGGPIGAFLADKVLFA